MCKKMLLKVQNNERHALDHSQDRKSSLNNEDIIF